MSKEKKIREIFLSIHRLVEISQSEKMRLNVDYKHIPNTKAFSQDADTIIEKQNINEIKGGWENIDFRKSQSNSKNQEFELLFKNCFLVWYKKKFRKTFAERIQKYLNHVHN